MPRPRLSTVFGVLAAIVGVWGGLNVLAGGTRLPDRLFLGVAGSVIVLVFCSAALRRLDEIAAALERQRRDERPGAGHR